MHKKTVDIWLHFYEYHKNEKYLFDGKQANHLKQLVGKIKKKVIEKGIEPTDENIINSLKAFLNTVKDPWVISNLDVSLVNSRFNVLYGKACEFKQAIDAVSTHFKTKYGTTGTTAS